MRFIIAVCVAAFIHRDVDRIRAAIAVVVFVVADLSVDGAGAA